MDAAFGFGPGTTLGDAGNHNNNKNSLIGRYVERAVSIFPKAVVGLRDLVPSSLQHLFLPRHLPCRMQEQNAASQRISNVCKEIVT